MPIPQRSAQRLLPFWALVLCSAVGTTGVGWMWEWFAVGWVLLEILVVRARVSAEKTGRREKRRTGVWYGLVPGRISSGRNGIGNEGVGWRWEWFAVGWVPPQTLVVRAVVSKENYGKERDMSNQVVDQTLELSIGAINLWRGRAARLTDALPNSKGGGLARKTTGRRKIRLTR
ncbi:hypothetical protein B0H11DRAFT_1922248 [Mycena galericulata]|nr:hypothetical protein B0H11DRAFT_1922248 [Mycena galericulata]